MKKAMTRNIRAKRINPNIANMTHTRIGVFDDSERFSIRFLFQHENPVKAFQSSDEEHDFWFDLTRRQARQLVNALTEKRITIEEIDEADKNSFAGWGKVVNLPVRCA